jgi:tetraacyldisaccharide 4'-kinase
MKAGELALSPLSALYSAAVRARLAAYERGLLKTSRLPKPVISVGNITVGGTGKTPLVEWICRELSAADRKVCVLSRGYGREKSNQRVLVSDGSTVLATEPEAGDEPLLLARNLVGIAAVISDANRLAAGLWAIENLGTDVFVLDDGFQHIQLERDLNVLVIDATNPFGGRQLLPNGRLREAVSGIGRADCTVITRADRARNLPSIKAEILELTSHRPVFVSAMKCRGLKSLAGEIITRKPTEPVAAFCAVGNPESFFIQLRAEGFNVSHAEQFPDHYRYTQPDIDRLIASSRSALATALVTTAKDSVKLTELHIPFPCYVLDINIQLYEQAEFHRLLEKTCSRKG